MQIRLLYKNNVAVFKNQDRIEVNLMITLTTGMCSLPNYLSLGWYEMKIGMVSIPQSCNILDTKHEQTDMPHIDVFFPRENL